MSTATASPRLIAPIGPTIVRLAAPNMIAMVVTMVTLTAEAWYVGQLGTEALAGLALGFPMMMMLVMMLSAGSFGGTITGAVARRLGAGDLTGAEVLAFHAVLLLVPMVFGLGAASTAMVGVHFGANAIARGQRAVGTAALYSAALCGGVGVVVALFPGLCGRAGPAHHCRHLAGCLDPVSASVGRLRESPFERLPRWQVPLPPTPC